MMMTVLISTCYQWNDITGRHWAWGKQTFQIDARIGGGKIALVLLLKWYLLIMVWSRGNRHVACYGYLLFGHLFCP